MALHSNAKLIETFYNCFKQRDHAGMLACYAPDIEFSDPVFTLQGKRAKSMWHMFCERGEDLTITVSGIEADETQGQAHWEARYTFSATGRQVHNVIDAQFRFHEGLIIWHQDHFNFWRWSRMALGPTGLFLGWTPMLRAKVRQRAASNLDKFIMAHPAYQ